MWMKREKGIVYERRELKRGEGRRQKKIYGRRVSQVGMLVVATSHFSHRKML